jgi:hypothetical protein
VRDGHFVKDFPLASGTPQAFWPALGFIGGREANAAPSADLVMEFANLTAVVACRPAFGRNQHLPYAEAGAVMRQIFTPKIEAKDVVSSVAARLMPEDIDFIGTVSQLMISANLWRSVERRQDIDSDFFEVHVHEYEQPALSIGVLPTRRYFVMDHRNSSVRIGASLAEVLDSAGVFSAARPAS